MLNLWSHFDWFWGLWEARSISLVRHLLSMVQISGEKTTWDVQNPVNNGINYDKLPTSTGERRISEPSTVCWGKGTSQIDSSKFAVHSLQHHWKGSSASSLRFPYANGSVTSAIFWKNHETWGFVRKNISPYGQFFWGIRILWITWIFELTGTSSPKFCFRFSPSHLYPRRLLNP